MKTFHYITKDGEGWIKLNDMEKNEPAPEINCTHYCFKRTVGHRICESQCVKCSNDATKRQEKTKVLVWVQSVIDKAKQP